MKFVGFSLFLAMVAVIQEVQSYRSVSGVRMGLFSHHPHSRQVLPGDTGGNEAVRTKTMQMQQWALAGVGAIFGFALSSPIPLPTENAYSFVHVAHADSTGKMSTKLTARKRYLPRIVTGVESFNAVQVCELSLIFKVQLFLYTVDMVPIPYFMLNLFLFSISQASY